MLRLNKLFNIYLSLLVRLEGKHDSWGNREFQILVPWFPLKCGPVSTPSSLNMALYPPLLLIVSDTGPFWLQSHRTTQNAHCALPSFARQFHLLQIIIGIMIFSIVIVVVTKFVHNLTTALLRPGVSSSTLLVSLSLLSSSKVVTCKLLSSSSIFLLLLSCGLEFHLFHLQVILGTTAKYIFGDIYIKMKFENGAGKVCLCKCSELADWKI